MDAHIIIAGDSNALGYLNTGPAPYAPTARVQIWADTNGDGVGDAWNYMRPGVNTGTAANPADWGPEVGEANTWLAAHAGDGAHLWIVKDAQTVKGSTTLAVDWAPAHGASPAGPLFASTSAAARAAMHNLDGTPYAFGHYDAAQLVLGENDAANPAYATAYGGELPGFLAALRADWGVQHVELSRISDQVGAPADNLAVRNAAWQADQADADLVTFKTIGFGLEPDGVHYDASGQLALGQAFYDGWIS